MLSTHIPNKLQEEKIELILVLQTHKIYKEKLSNGFTSEDSTLEIIYSQFKIMQIVQAYPEAAVLAEGYTCDVTPSDRIKEDALIFREIFPEYKNLQAMNFDNLTQNQKAVLAYNHGVQILFNLGIIPLIYRTAASRPNIEKLIAALPDSYRECLMHYPELFVKALRKGGVSIKDLVTFNELEDYEKFIKLFHQKNPDMYCNREKEALDFVISAAKKSGKKQIVLVFGKDHSEGFSELIKTTYCDQITLKLCINSSEGFNNPDERNKLQIEHKEATERYASGRYKSAASIFKRQVCFWQATPKSTPTKFSSLLVAEFNLGSALFKLAESDEDCSYGEAIPHLENAVTLCSKMHAPKLKSKKYIDRHSDAVKRHSVILFFNEKFESKVSNLIARYVTDEEVSEADSLKSKMSG